MFTKHKVFFYFMGNWHAAYRLHPRILPDLRNFAKLGHINLYPRFCWALYMKWSSSSSHLFLSRSLIRCRQPIYLSIPLQTCAIARRVFSSPSPISSVHFGLSLYHSLPAAADPVIDA